MKKSILVIAGIILTYILPFVFPYSGLIRQISGFAFYGLLIYGLFLIVMFFKNKSSTSSSKEIVNEWLNGISTIDYKHQYKNDGIAVDKNNRTLYLKNGSLEKEYTFNDVREWETNISSGGEIHNMTGKTSNAIYAFGQNQKQKKENRRQTGLFISVKDVDHPKWRIGFKYNGKKSDSNLEKELARWMEILRQSINE